MLTKEALMERMWGSFPALRKLLENKKIPDSIYGYTSVSDNIFSQTERLIEIIILVREFISRDKIRQNDDHNLLNTDLKRLCVDIENMENFFRTARQEIQIIL
jgi:hypothetical protein